MKPDAMLKLAVQVLGLVFLYHGLMNLPMAVVSVCEGIGQLRVVGTLTTVAMAAWPFALAYSLLRHASHIVQISYPDKPQAAKDGR